MNMSVRFTTDIYKAGVTVRNTDSADSPHSVTTPEITAFAARRVQWFSVLQAMPMTLQSSRIERHRLLVGLPPKPANRRPGAGSKPASRSAATGCAGLSFRTVLLHRGWRFPRGFGSLPALLNA
jgi:hypothetical protein